MATAKKTTRRTSSSAASRTKPAVKDRTKAYAQAVVKGKVVAGPHVRNACRRHLDDLKNGKKRGLTFDIDAADRVFRFFEDMLRLSEGQFEGTPFKLHPSQAFILGSLFGWMRKDGRRRFRRAYIEQGKGNGKALALDTPIPTPTGWTTMGCLHVGDWVFDETGKPCQVIEAHPVSTDRECYRVEFDDGDDIVASAEHLWLTWDASSRQALANAGVKNYPESWTRWKSVRGKKPCVLETSQIAKTIDVKPGYRNHSIPTAGCLDLPDVDLLVDPMVLGVWLGDGSSSSGSSRIAADHLNGDQRLIRDEFHRRGYQTTDISDPVQFGVPGMITQLRMLGLVGRKHVPSIYLRGSVGQRLDLLRGLMLTDGTVTEAGQVAFENTNEDLIDAVFELASSIGQKPRKGSLHRKTVAGKSVWRIQWSPTIDVFGIGRKSARLRLGGAQSIRRHHRMIVSCDRVASVPVRCITVDSSSGMFLAGSSMIPTHNSPIAGGIGLYGLCADGEAGSQVYSAAAKRDQAAILFADAVKMVKQSPALSKRLEFSGGEGREFNIAYHRSGSFFRAVSRDTGKSGSGPRPYFVLADEIHEFPDRRILETLERGFKFRRNPLLFMITNSGSDRNSVAWEEHEHAVKVAAGNVDAVTDPTYQGNVIDDNTFSFVSSLDDDDDPLEDPTCWEKANPLLGVTITKDYLAEVVAQAKAIPGQLNGILRLHFCVWTDAEKAWMSRASLEPLLADFDPIDHKGAEICLGLDLSQNRDITALGAVVETGRTDDDKPVYDAWVDAWTPGDTLKARELRDKVPYSVWAKQGHIHAPPGESINFRHVAQMLVEYDEDYDVRLVAYDSYAFRRFETEVSEVGLTLPFAEHVQGGLKKGKPTPEMIAAAKRAGKDPEGLWMPASVRLLEEAILEGRIRIKRNPVLISAFMSAVPEADKWGNYWLSKERSINKIDAVIALCMAIGAAEKVLSEPQQGVQMFVLG